MAVSRHAHSHPNVPCLGESAFVCSGVMIRSKLLQNERSIKSIENAGVFSNISSKKSQIDD